MSTFITKIPQTTRPVIELPKQERQEILSFLKAHPKSRKAVPAMMKKYRVTETGISKLMLQDGYFFIE